MAVTPEELKAALQNTKSNKAAIYPEMLKKLGAIAIKWIAQAFTDIIDTVKLPSYWNTAKVIGILKSGKDAKEPSSYRPITLLNCSFKLLKRIILSRITPVVDPFIPLEQTGFRKRRNTTEQVLALNTYIESDFEQKLKTGTVFMDLSAAYDTVWHDGLMLKFARIIPYKKMLRLISSMIGTR